MDVNQPSKYSQLAIKEAKNKYFALDHQQTIIEGNNLKEIPSENIIKKTTSSDSDNETNTENSADFGDTSTSFEEIGEDLTTIGKEKITENKSLIRQFSDVVLAAVVATTEKAIATTDNVKHAQSPKLKGSSLNVVNSVPKPPRYSLENDKRDFSNLAMELESLLDKKSNNEENCPELPKTSVPTENEAVSFAKTNFN